MTKLAPCPDCRTMISRAATACPKCGRPIKPEDLQPKESESLPWGWIIIGLLIIAAFIFASQQPSQRDLDKSREKWLEQHGK